jgi:pSer/pThr/pTyr-binding forkhead associated (FHA) protein
VPKLVLQFENRVLKEYALGLMVSIGRLPDNTVTIDNPAVSNRHACVFRDGDRFIVEDLQSTNGTFVNEKRVTRRHTLQNGDVVLVGKHKLVFDEIATGDTASPVEVEAKLSNLSDTVYLDTVQHRALLARLHETPLPTAEPDATGVLCVLAGRADRTEYSLDAHTSVIGGAETNLVRLKGWFKPKAAVAITRKAGSYAATLLRGKTFINGQRLSGRHDLKSGDILRVSGLTLQFRLKE